MKLLTLILIPYFFLGSLMPRADFSQFEHFGDLRTHYLLHLEEANLNDQTFTFWDFIYLHFFSPDEHSHSDRGDAHHNLPLQIVTSSLSFVVGLIFELGDSNGRMEKNAVYKNVFHLQGFLPAIFHPPFLS